MAIKNPTTVGNKSCDGVKRVLTVKKQRPPMGILPITYIYWLAFRHAKCTGVAFSFGTERPVCIVTFRFHHRYLLHIYPKKVTAHAPMLHGCRLRSMISVSSFVPFPKSNASKQNYDVCLLASIFNPDSATICRQYSYADRNPSLQVHSFSSTNFLHTLGNAYRLPQTFPRLRLF